MGAPGHGGDLARCSDAELVRRAARLEPAAFTVLYERHSAAAFGLARRMLGSQARAEDAVQEAYLALWRAAGRYDASRGPVRTWLLGIVRNRSIDLLRKMDVHEHRQIAVDGVEERFVVEEDTAGDLVRREDAARAREALAALPLEQRQVLELAYFGGLTQAEIAEQLEVPLGTVKGRTRLGLTKLRDQLVGTTRAPG